MVFATTTGTGNIVTLHAEASAPLDLTRMGFAAADVATPNGRMRLHRSGSGPSILLVHGIGGGASSYYWSRVAPLLTPGHTVWAPDLVGWGDSDHPRRFLRFEDYVAQLEVALRHIGDAVALVGQGLSAGFVIAAAQRRPMREAQRLILLAPTGGRDYGKDAFDPFFALTLGLLARLPVINMALYRRYFHRRAAYRFWFERRGFLDPEKVPDDLVEAGLRSGTKPDAAYAALPFVAGSLRYDIAPWLRRIDRPALMLWGSHEAQIKPEIRTRLETANPARITVRTIPRTRTNFEMESPEATAEAVLGFMGNER